MTTEQASKNIENIVMWINKNCPKMDRTLHFGFGDYGLRRYPDHHQEWDLAISKDGNVTIESVCHRGEFDRFENPDTRYYPHFTYSQMAEQDLAGANDLMLAWSSIKERILSEVARLKSLEDFQV